MAALVCERTHFAIDTFDRFGNRCKKVLPPATPIPPTATTQSQASLNKTAAAKLVNSAAKTAAAKLLP